MAKFQYLPSITSPRAEQLSLEKFEELINSDAVSINVGLARRALAEGNKEAYTKAKQLLPSVMWVGYDATGHGRRKADALTPTQYLMIDLDHVHDIEVEQLALFVVDACSVAGGDNWLKLIHVTPSGSGMRIVFRAIKDFPTVKQHMDWFINEVFGNLTQYFDYDSACKDLSRQSFIVPKKDILFFDQGIFNEDETEKPIQKAYEEQTTPTAKADSGSAETDGLGTAPTDYSQAEYRGHKLSEIAKKYVEVKGAPEVGERHNFYNDLVKNFRTICNNNPYMVHAILPRFGNSEQETLSQCKAICRTNTVGRIPKDFFFFLLDNGYYPKRESEMDAELRAYLEKETPAKPSVRSTLPTLPPVFREFVDSAPDDFIWPTINALMPIMGTLTSYCHCYDWDGKDQSSTFFNVIYAPPSSGKSYINRLLKPLFAKTEERDEIASMREAIYLTECSRKSANDKEPDDPHVSVRIMEAINSQPEFLTKMRDNKGYHMFTCSEEVDTFNKGTRAGGTDKSDLFRVAWDNGKYGQAFKSKTTFKGKVQLFYNLLLTGTPNQVKRLYANVEDGMVTRVSFCKIENQDFAKRPVWKKLNKKQMAVIEKFVERCDRNTYREPLNFSVEAALQVDDKDYAKTVPWKYTYRPYQYVDMQWLFKDIDRWQEKKRKLASMNEDKAMDTFMKRVGLKGLRLALVCMCCWEKVNERERNIIRDFVLSWMEQDLEQSLLLHGQKYNEVMSEATKELSKAKNNPGLFDSLPEEFEKADLVAKALQMAVFSPVDTIVSRWKKEGIIKKTSKEHWKKIA